jgi:hypothetical protein
MKPRRPEAHNERTTESFRNRCIAELGSIGDRGLRQRRAFQSQT